MIGWLGASNNILRVRWEKAWVWEEFEIEGDDWTISGSEVTEVSKSVVAGLLDFP